MKVCLLVFLFHLLARGYCDSDDVHVGYQVTLAIPVEYASGFVGRAFVMEAGSQKEPHFRAAVSVEAVNEKYACSLDVFLASVKVWSSGHLSRFYTTDKCMLELTQDGDLQLRGQKEGVLGWRSGTSGQGVKRLHLLETGNLVLVDVFNLIKWQSFNFPTDVMLWGQGLSSKTRLTSFISNSSMFYSFEIQYDKIALYLNSGQWKYSYWEFKPIDQQNITFVQLTSKALEIFDGKFQKVAQINASQEVEPLRFLALGNNSGNLGLYYYSNDKAEFQASYQALNSRCDFPLACNSYGICTFSNACSCIRLVRRGSGSISDCGSEGISEGTCGRSQAEMLELKGVSSVLRGIPSKVNVSREECADLCLDDCTCVAALYSSNEANAESKECFLYGLVRGVKLVERRSNLIYMVKVPKGADQAAHGKRPGLKKWVAIVVGVVDGFIILLVLGGIGYYFIWKRRKKSLDAGHPP